MLSKHLIIHSKRFCSFCKPSRLAPKNTLIIHSLFKTIISNIHEHGQKSWGRVGVGGCQGIMILLLAKFLFRFVKISSVRQNSSENCIFPRGLAFNKNYSTPMAPLVPPCMISSPSLTVKLLRALRNFQHFWNFNWDNLLISGHFEKL